MGIRLDFRRRFRRGLPFALAVAGALITAGLSAQQPNIVIVNIDDMGWGDFAVYGSQYAQTPNIDVLANQGTRFTQFYNARADLLAVAPGC